MRAPSLRVLRCTPSHALTRVSCLHSRLISAIRNSTSTGVGGATALDREFDKSIADELDAFDPDLMEDLTVGVKGRKRRRGKRGVRPPPRSSLAHLH